MRHSECTNNSLKTRPYVRGMRGFSLLEMMITLAIALTAGSIFFISLMPAMRQQKVTNAYNTTLMTIRRAREQSIAERRTYIVTFSNAAIPNTITITQAATGIAIATMTLPNEIQFSAEPGIPTAAAQTPDRFGIGATAIDFDQNVAGGAKNALFFYPDGSAQDLNNNINNGVIYLARPGELYSSRAITVWGATGRIRGWRLYLVGGVKTWSQQ